MANTFNVTLGTLLDAARTAIAAVVACLLARMLKLPEFYWAPISAIVIIESTIDPKTLSWQRFAGTGLGAVVAALVGTFFASNLLAYGISVFLCGVLCTMLRIDGAYRFAAITLSTILLIAHRNPAWIVSWHRFVEVSLGIAVGLGLALLWPIRAKG